MTILAIDGGKPARGEPFAAWPMFGSDEIEAVSRVLASGKVNYWTGEECAAFEEEFAAAFSRRRAISLANGTLALELGLLALGIGPGDEVVVPSRTFIATASCVVARGARPVVADADADSGNLTASTIAAALTPHTRAVIVVHLAGWPCDMDAILALAAERGIHVIEDCAQSHGATYRGRPAGCFGVCAAFSFCQDKIMTTGGEGGMLVTDDEALWRRAWEYKDHGKSWEAVKTRQYPRGFRWLHESFGSNYRMTEMQAAIGRRQLTKLPDWVARRRRNADALAAGLANLPGLRVPRPGPDVGHAYYKFYAFLEPEALRPGWDQSRIIEAINAEGVPCLAGGCCEIYREKAFVAAGLAPVRPLAVAQRLSRTSLMFLVHPTLDANDMDDAAAAVAKVMRAAAG
jgi:dTDP-4-amino-4,6-dideoxygalactose transaminase